MCLWLLSLGIVMMCPQEANFGSLQTAVTALQVWVTCCRSLTSLGAPLCDMPVMILATVRLVRFAFLTIRGQQKKNETTTPHHFEIEEIFDRFVVNFLKFAAHIILAGVSFL
jgi:hypothetical protein